MIIERGRDCPRCGQDAWWRNIAGTLVCAVCQPPPHQGEASRVFNAAGGVN